MELRDIKTLKKLPNNPRTIKDESFATLCDSIRDNPKYFEARPLILSDRTGELIIIAGNQRYEAAKSLNLKKVPTFLISGLTEDKEREIVVRDNINNGEWDIKELKKWDDLPLEEWGVQFSKGKMMESFNTETESFTPEKMKWPITIVVDEQDYVRWSQIKDRLGITNDKTAFFKIISEVIE